jgi:hypothetical protein
VDPAVSEAGGLKPFSADPMPIEPGEDQLTAANQGNDRARR